MAGELVEPRRTPVGQGSTVRFRGEWMKVVAWRRDDGPLSVVLESAEGDFQVVTWAELVGGLLDKEPESLLEGEDAITPILQELPPDERARIQRRYALLLQIQTGSRTGNPEGDRAQGTLSPLFDPEATSRGERVRTACSMLRAQGERASDATLYRQLKLVADGGIDALVHRSRKLPRQRLREEPPAVVDTVRTFLEQHRDQAARIAQTKLVTLVAAELEAQGLAGDVSRYRVTRLVAELSRGLGLGYDASGRRTHGNKPDRVYGRMVPTCPGEMVQIDGTNTSIHIWDADLGWVTAVVLTAIDAYTREILALRVCAQASTARDVGLLLWDIGRPTVSRAGWPYQLDHWHGVPQLVHVPDASQPSQDPLDPIIGSKAAVQPSAIVLDRGADMSADQLMAAAERAGIAVIFCPPGTPHAKGIVESWHNAVREMQSLLEGFKGENPTNHPRGIEQRALLTAQDLHDALWEYVLTVYRWRPHRGLTESLESPVPLSPGEVFQNYVDHGGLIQVPDDPFRMITFLSSADCSVQPYGIRVEKRIYNSPELHQIRAYFQAGIGASRRKLTVFYDRFVTSHIYARNPATGSWLCIPRAGSSVTIERPWSELIGRHLLHQAASGGSPNLTDRELFDAEKALVRRWRSDASLDRREARLAAVEANRARDVAHDVADMPPEMRRLTYGEPTPDTPAPRGFADSAVTDEDHLAYDDIEVDGLML